MAAKAKFVKYAKKVAKSKTGMELTKLLKDQVEEAYREKLARTPAAQLVTIALNASRGGRTVQGADGVNLNATVNREVSIVGEAKGDFSTSASMFMYRPQRKRTLDGVKYIQKVRSTMDKSSPAGAQAHWDIDILDAVPVQNNPDSNEKYSNLSVKKAFDNFLVAANIGATDQLKLQQTSIHMKSLSAEFNITNTAGHKVILDLYEVVPKYALGPSIYSNQGFATGYMSPSWAWLVGLNADTPQLADELTSTTVGSKPTDSLNFSRTWKIVKHVKVNLTAGSTHIHKMAYAINKTISYQEYKQMSADGGKYAGWNPTMLFRLRGVPQTTYPLSSQGDVAVYADMQLDYSGYMSEGARAIVFNDKT